MVNILPVPIKSTLLLSNPHKKVQNFPNARTYDSKKADIII